MGDEEWHLVDFLHPGSVFVITLKRRHVIIGGGDVVGDFRVSVFVETESELNHAVDAAGVNLRIFETESGSEERRFIQKHDEILDGFVILVGIGLFAESLHDRVLGVDLQLMKEQECVSFKTWKIPRVFL